MPDLPLVHQIYLGGVLCAFAVFMVAVAWGYFQSNRRPSPPRGWRSAGAGEVAQRRPVREAQAARAFELDRA